MPSAFLACAGDWGYLICRTPDTAVALEAASEDADIRVSGHVIRVQSFTTASLMYSPSLNRSTSSGGPISQWRPSAAYAVYPDDYSDRPHGDSSMDYNMADDYPPNESPHSLDGEFLPDACALTEAEFKTSAGMSLYKCEHTHVSAWQLIMPNACRKTWLLGCSLWYRL